MTAFIKRISEKIQYVYNMRKKIKHVFLEKGFLATLRIGIRFIKYGRNGVFYKTQQPSYNHWIRNSEEVISMNEMVRIIKTWEYTPLISVVIPVYNVAPKWLDACIESVIVQGYTHWELCIYDDASTNKQTIDCLKKWQQKDIRIKVSYGIENLHISGASNKAVDLVTGEFIALVDNDDTISPDALFEVVQSLQKNREIDFLYSDEDKLDEQGMRVEPFFKPDWSLHLFRSMMYVCHLSVFRTSIVKQIGGFRKGFEGSQDYDMVLRFIERTDASRILHIPKVLYHWRKIPGSAAAAVDAKSYAYGAAQRALQEHVDRTGLNAQAVFGKHTSLYRIKYSIPVKPLVSIIIPFRDQKKNLEVCVTSIIKNTHYPNYEIILVNNQSGRDTEHYIKKLTHQYGASIRIMNYDKEFNFADMNNQAVIIAAGEYLLFLNNDTKILQTDWIEGMLEYAQQDSVGAVGCKLFYANGAIQHAGVVMGLGGVAAHPFVGQYGGAYGFPDVVREYSAVTAACMMVRKELFQEVGGFDAEHLPISYNDIDLCLRFREKGYLIVYTPFTEVLHYESLSRGNDNDEIILENDVARKKRIDDERSFMMNRWGAVINEDPYYNKNLEKRKADYSVKII